MDWNALYLFELITMRVSGFVFTNPLFGRNNLTSLDKGGVCTGALRLCLDHGGCRGDGAGHGGGAGGAPFAELCVGVILAFVMQLFFSVVQLGGEVIDAQMGLNMAQVYDSSSQVNMTVTTSLLNVLLVLTFFAENGHYTLLRIFLSSGSVVPYGPCPWDRRWFRG